MRFELLIVLVCLLGFVSATSVTCIIVDDKVLVEVELSNGASVILPEEYSLLEEKGSEVSFITRDFIRKDGEWIFVLPRVVDLDYDLEVYLPQGYVLVDDLVFPKGYEISSDGTSIILEWRDIDKNEVIVFYEGFENSYFWFWVGITGLVFLGIGFFVLEKRKFSNKIKKLNRENKTKDRGAKKELVSHNLFGDEKRIVELLAKRKSCWMKYLVRELGISKVMCTRKVRSLVEKGIVEKENFGRENRVKLRRAR